MSEEHICEFCSGIPTNATVEQIAGKLAEEIHTSYRNVIYALTGLEANNDGGNTKRLIAEKITAALAPLLARIDALTTERNNRVRELEAAQTKSVNLQAELEQATKTIRIWQKNAADTSRACSVLSDHKAQLQSRLSKSDSALKLAMAIMEEDEKAVLARLATAEGETAEVREMWLQEQRKREAAEADTARFRFALEDIATNSSATYGKSVAVAALAARAKEGQ